MSRCIPPKRPAQIISYIPSFFIPLFLLFYSSYFLAFHCMDRAQYKIKNSAFEGVPVQDFWDFLDPKMYFGVKTMCKKFQKVPTLGCDFPRMGVLRFSLSILSIFLSHIRQHWWLEDSTSDPSYCLVKLLLSNSVLTIMMIIYFCPISCNICESQIVTRGQY